MSNVDSTIPSGFRPIADFPRYCISEDGTVLSICSRNGRGAAKPWGEAHRIAPVIAPNGYHRVSLCSGGHTQQAAVHTLVLETFVGPCPHRHECRHLDGNKTNNRISNLAWGTHSENMHDRVLHGTSCRGEKNGIAKLKATDVLEIRRRAESGEPHRAIASDFHIARVTVSGIKNRHNWKHI